MQSAEIIDNAVTLAKMAGGTDGNLITYDTSGNPAYVVSGGTGEVLTSRGGGNTPTFQTAATTSTRTIAKAWAYFTASGTVVTSFNVSSVDNDDGAGLYSINLTTDFSGNAIVAGNCGVSNDGAFIAIRTHIPQGDAEFKVLTRNYAGTVSGISYNSLIIFGG